MVKLTKKFNRVNQQFSSRDLKVGEMMEVNDSNWNLHGQIVLRVYGAIVSLSDPRNTWDVNVPGMSFNGRKLLPDEVVELMNDLE